MFSLVQDLFINDTLGYHVTVSATSTVTTDFETHASTYQKGITIRGEYPRLQSWEDVN